MKYLENLENNDSTKNQVPIPTNQNEKNYNTLEQQTIQSEENN